MTATARQARYEPSTQVVTTTPTGNLVRHYVRTRHGIVARTWCGLVVEIVLRRRRHVRGTYQGTVEPVAGGWVAIDAEGNRHGDRAPNYIDAEARLLPIHTGQVARAAYQWPYTP